MEHSPLAQGVPAMQPPGGRNHSWSWGGANPNAGICDTDRPGIGTTNGREGLFCTGDAQCGGNVGSCLLAPRPGTAWYFIAAGHAPGNPAQRIGSARAQNAHQNNRGNPALATLAQLPMDGSCDLITQLCTDEWSVGRPCSTGAYCVGGGNAGRRCNLLLGPGCPGDQGNGLCNTDPATQCNPVTLRCFVGENIPCTVPTEGVDCVNKCFRGLVGIACGGGTDAQNNTSCDAPAFCHDGCAFCE